MGFELMGSFLFGLVFGSFLNVCIYRLPRGESLWKPRSHCPLCCQPIPPHLNVPVISFLVLRGRCRRCGGRISAAYPLVELATGVLAVMTYRLWGFSLVGGACFLFLSALLVISVIDINLQMIPDVLTLPGIAVSLLAAPVLPSGTILRSLVGALMGGGILWLVAWMYERSTGRQGMGGGDVKLLSFIGAVLGWQSVLTVLFLASLGGSLYGLFLMFKYRVGPRHAVPFGPFLCAGAAAVFFARDLSLAFEDVSSVFSLL